MSNLLGLPPPKPPIPEQGPGLLASVDIKYVPLCVDLCHWIHEITGIPIECEQFWNRIQNGCTLNELMNKLTQIECYKNKDVYKYIGYTKKEDLGDKLFYCRLNIEAFITWSKKWGCDEMTLCTVADLAERKDLERVLSCIHAVARRAAEVKIPYPRAVRMEVKHHMSYNDIVTLFEQDHKSLSAFDVDVKQSFADLCEARSLGKIDITVPLEHHRADWAVRLQGMWAGEQPDPVQDNGEED